MREMSREGARRFLLEGTRTAKLATTTRDGHPHVVPVWFVLDGQQIVFTTNRETVKGRYLRREGRVALCVDEEQPVIARSDIAGW